MMNEISNRKLIGSVRSVRIALAEWNAGQGVWEPLRAREVLVFRRDGGLERADYHNPDGSVATTSCVYDDAGRVTETRFRAGDGTVSRRVHTCDEAGRPARVELVDASGASREIERYHYGGRGLRTKVQYLEVRSANVAFGYEGSEQSIGAPGATSVTVSYDEQERPVETVFHGPGGAMVRRVAMVRDAAGRLVGEEVSFGGQSPFPIAPALPGASAGDHAALAGVVASAFAGGLFSTTSYAYDEAGRLTEKITRIGLLSEQRERFRYDGHGNPVEQESVTVSREIGQDERGAPVARESPPVEGRWRFEYRYDARGNWTERIVSIRHMDAAGFQPSNIERREIAYYET